MRLRRFVGPDTATALRRVKETLGPEAVILHTRACSEGVEITAAVDAALVTPPLGRATVTASPASSGTPAAAAIGPNGAADVAAIARELAELTARVRELDRTLRPPAAEIASLGSEARVLAEQLTLRGLAADLAAPIGAAFEAARRDGAPAGAALETSLARHLAAAPAPEARVTAFVGPTGAGKTTTIAKLAARHAGAARARVALVMADGVRVGAHEQLGAYARLLDVPMAIARDGRELRDALARFADRDTVYVDTAGLGGDTGETATVERLLGDAGERVARTAVVSAGASERALDAAWRHLGTLTPSSCVVTKLDETPTLGPACTWIAERRLTLAWLGVGQRVPEDLAAPSPSALVRWLVAA